MPTLEEIVERLATVEADQFNDEYELIDTIRIEFGLSEDEAEDIRNALEDRGMLQIERSSRPIVTQRFNPEAQYDALSAAAEDITPRAQLIGQRDPELPGTRYTAESLGLDENEIPKRGSELPSGRTPVGETASEAHLRDLTRGDQVQDIDAQGEYVVADPAGDYDLSEAARVQGHRYYDGEGVVLGTTATFSDEESAPRSTRHDEQPYDPRGTNDD
ncbi:MAG TPA: hypothetical protein VNT60_03310 [Deinococcales bacterium]|nr:hypothetical protein [Deinococcales bacterium]